MRRVVSSLQDVSPALRPETKVFDDTMRRVVSSLQDALPALRPETKVFDDTMCRVVSSLQDVSPALRPETKVLDDTMRRVVSSLQALLKPPPRITPYIPSFPCTLRTIIVISSSCCHPVHTES